PLLVHMLSNSLSLIILAISIVK
ncbi:CPBP family intramembrane metalloprotease, partial [Streptococcus pneumoniae]